LQSNADRVALILQIAQHCRSDQNLRWSQVEFVLNSMGFDTSVQGLEEQIDTGTDEQLCDLAKALGLDIPTGASTSTSATTAAAATEPLFIFGSHRSAYKALVGTVRENLLTFGIELFVAHNTIKHDKAWEDEIKKGLDRAHAGLVFVHPDFRGSEWCDQEVGWLQGGMSLSCR
jgi:TIR domain